jgi:hypothetical protein
VNRLQLAHILRASCQIARDKNVLVVGSQAILGSYDADQLPAAVLMSMEADIAFLDDPDRSKADDVEGAIGEMSPFHDATRFTPRAFTSTPPFFRQDGATDSPGCGPTNGSRATAHRTCSSEPATAR